jgi:hypothetical protein
MRFRVVGTRHDSGEGVDMEIEAPDLNWARHMAQRRGIRIDSVDPAPLPRPQEHPVRLDRRAPDGSTVGGLFVAIPAPPAPRGPRWRAE